jgi:hypothetical protein
MTEKEIQSLKEGDFFQHESGRLTCLIERYEEIPIEELGPNICYGGKWFSVRIMESYKRQSTRGEHRMGGWRAMSDNPPFWKGWKRIA